MKIVFVCTGNRYRSQAAEIIFRNMVGPFAQVRSAGVSEKLETGRPTPKKLWLALSAMGYKIDRLIESKKLTGEMVEWADLLITMQPSHGEAILQKFGNEVMPKVHPLVSYSMNFKDKKVDDLVSLGEADFNRTLKKMETFIRNLVKGYNLPQRFPRSQPKAINIRGTNGSGKSHIIFQLMKKFGKSPLQDEKAKNPWAYSLAHCPIHILGKYVEGTFNSGTDNMKSYDIISKSLKRLVDKVGQEDILIEGLMLTGMPEPSMRLQTVAPDHHFIFATLDTPLALCLKRVYERKEKEKLFDPKWVIRKYFSSFSAHRRFEKEGVDCRILDYRKPVSTILSWLEE